MAIKFSQFNLRTDHTSGMYLVGYDGNQNIHITVDNLFDDFINGTENTIAMFGTDGAVLADSILSQDVGATILTVAGELNVDAAATFDTSITVTGDSTLNGNVILGDASTDLITQTGTLYLNGPVKDTTDTLGVVDQVLLSNAVGELTFTDLADLHVGGAEVVELPVKNVQGSALVKGDPVYISGSVGASGRLEVQLADASNTLKMPAVGLLKQDLANNAEGFAVVTGKLRNLITDPIDGVSPTENDVIYIKPSGTSGAALTTTKPVYGNFIQNIGKVGRVSTSNDGNFVVSSILRTNDIPNLTPGRLWIGSTGNTIESQTIFVDEATGEVGIGTTDPYTELHIKNTVDNPGLMIESEEATGGIYQNSYINLRARESSTNTLANGTISIHGVNSTSDAGAKTLRIRNQTLGGADVLISTLDSSNAGKNPARFKSSGQVQFEEYGSGSFTGTIAKNLSIDSSGNIIETNPAVDGSGTLNYVTKWTPDGNSLGNSIIFDNGSQVAIGTTSPAASVKLHVEGALRVNGGNLNVTNTSLPIIYLNTSSSSTDNYALQNSGGNFQVKNNAGLGQIQFQILNSGQAKLDLYGQNTFTGTAAKNLSVTSSGAIIETDAVPANIVETITTTDGTYINLTPNSATDGAVTITADLSATDGTAAAGERYLTKNNAWATIASIPGTYTFNVTGGTGTPEAIASGATLDIAGGTNISTVVGLAADTVTVNLDDSISLTGSLTVGTTGNFTGQVTIPQVPSANTDAASKHYVDQAVTSALSYQGGYDASVAPPTGASVKKGFTYTVTTAGDGNGFFSVPLEVGDLIIAEQDNPTAEANWTTVQNNVDLATLTTVGIGNVTAGTNIGVSYSNGTAQISNAITNNNQLTNGAGYLTSASLPTVNNGTLTLSTSTGLDGGASFTANQSGNSAFTVSLDLSELTDMTAGVSGANDELILLDSGAERRKRIGEINLGQFNNDQGWTSNVGDITAVTAGNALTGGGTSGSVTINLSTEGPGAGTYGSSSDSIKIDTITIDAYGRIQGLITGPTGSMSSWTIKEGNGTESTSVTNGETLTIAQGTGIQSEMTSTSSGGTITITNTAPDTGTPAVLSNGSTPSLNTGISASEMRSLIGAGTGSGDITAVTAGSYLSGGATSGSATLNLDYGVSGNWWDKAVVTGSTGVTEVGKYIDFHDSDSHTGDYNYRITSSGGRLYLSGDLEVDGGDIYINDSNTHLKEGSGNSLKVQTNSGYVEVGAQNASYAHFTTDRGAFYFSKRIEIGDNQIRSYSGDFNINRAGSTTARLRITSGTTISDQALQSASTVRSQFNSGDYSQLESNDSGGVLKALSGGSTNVLFRAYGDSYTLNDFGIGTSSPSARLSVENTTSTTSSGIVRLKSLTVSNGPFIRVVDFVRSNNSTRGYIAMNPYSVQYNSTSDYRLKRNVTPMENSIDRIKLLKPSRFNWVEGPDDYVVDGFIAHEVQDVVHDAVSGEKDAVDKNNEPAYQGIDQSKLVPLLTAALQDAITKIENLETRIQTLERN